ncbi:MAG: hypothetical protein LBD12_00610 [Clostridiales Family XIII bacterium]|jgi:epoxyqueuosine reductase QueG|nr:hypothetical protein [Clostridiales Family XIII bacterium]
MNAQTLKAYVRDACGMDLVGIADVQWLADEPEGHRPEDILPGARAVVVFGRRMPEGGVQAAFRAMEDGNHAARTSYNLYCADLAQSFSLFFGTYDLAQHIERATGHVAAPLPCASMQAGVPSSVPVPAFAAPHKVGLPFDIEKAAFAAGLGEYGWSGRFLTPEFGARVLFGAVLTTLPLDCDAPMPGRGLCGGADCLACVAHCPTHAIADPSEGRVRCIGIGSGGGGDKGNGAVGSDASGGAGSRLSCTVAAFSLNRCAVAACGLRRQYGGREDYVDSDDPTDAALAAAFAGMPINHFEGLDHYPKWRCDRCLVYCRAGSFQERFVDTGYSKDPTDFAAEAAGSGQQVRT